MIDIKLDLLIGQLITFLLGILLLWLIAYKPIREVFRKRAEKIENDLKSAEQNRLEMERMKSRYSEELSRIELKAQEIIRQAVREGTVSREEIIREARAQSQEILSRAKEEISDEKEKAMKEIRREVVNLSLLVAEKVISATVDPGKQRQLAEEVFAELEKEKP